MKRGKTICKTLKEIRLQVARANDIPYEPTTCNHKGDCPGTCPLCDAELDALQQQIDAMEAEGKKVNLDVLTDEEKRVLFTLVDMPDDDSDDGKHILMGDVVAPDEWEFGKEEVTMGMPAMPEDFVSKQHKKK